MLLTYRDYKNVQTNNLTTNKSENIWFKYQQSESRKELEKYKNRNVGIINFINIKISFLFHTFGIKSYFPTVFLTMKYVEWKLFFSFILSPYSPYISLAYILAHKSYNILILFPSLITP